MVMMKALTKNEPTHKRIEIINEWIDSISDKKRMKAFKSAFATLNNPNRWKYIWQTNTVTHEKYLTFLALFKRILKREERKSSDFDEFMSVASRLFNDDNNTAPFTLYLILKVFKKKKLELLNLGLKFDEFKPGMVLDLIPDRKYYKNYNIYHDKIKEIIKEKL